VLLTFPVKIVGETGPTASDVNVGFTKKPRQLIASAKVASAANAPPKRSLDFIENMVFWNSLGAQPWAWKLLLKANRYLKL